jgi:SAM-dependent methyltransferase
MYADADAAALYDLLNPWGPSDDFYLSYVIDAPSVLDVGCGTGMLLHRARECGHTGRLCGLDPDAAALGRARARTDIEWVEGRAADMAWNREFALAVMASNVFQVFVTDDELHASLAAVRAALVDDGQLVFGTRNPRVRSWERWDPSHPIDVVDHTGRELRIVYHVEAVMDDVSPSPRRPRPATASRCVSTGHACASSTSTVSTRPLAGPASRSRPASATGRAAR